MSAVAQVIHMDDHRTTQGPQLEDGYLRIANELFDALLRFRFTLKQQSVAFAIVRKTYGYGKKTDDVSASQIGELCGMARNHVTETLHQLAAMNVISLERGEYGMLVGINKHHRQWKEAVKAVTSPGSGLVPNRDAASPESGLVLVPNQDRSIVPNRDTQKTTFQKTTSKDNLNSVHPAGRTRTSGSPDFDAFWSAYPRKDKKADALKAFAKLAPDASLLADMVARVELLKQTDDWMKDAGQFIPLAASWLNGRRWEDEAPQMGYTADELRVIDAYNRVTDGTDWPEAKAAPYSRERAGLIRTFLGFLAKGAESVEPYFRRVAESVPAADTTGFDWLLRRETYLKIREGVHRQRAEV